MAITESRIPKLNQIGPDPKEWVKAAISFDAQAVGPRKDGHLDIIEISDSKLLSMDSIAYVNTDSRNPYIEGGESSMAKYQVVVKPEEDGGFVVECPSIPGCMSQGETIEEALENIKEAIQGCLEARQELGMPLTVDVYEVEV